MIRIFSCLVLALVFSVNYLPAVAKEPRNRKSASDLERLQGTWLADSEPGLQARLVLEGSRLHLVNVRGGEETVVWDGHFAINELADPREMDWTPLRRDGRSPPANLAIYRLEGDLLLVIGNTEGPRPAAFYSGGGEYRPKTVIYRRAQGVGDTDSAMRGFPKPEPATAAPVPPCADGAADLESAPLVLDGYCPVTLFAHETWTRGSPEQTAVHDGMRFYFADEESRETFLSDPDRYTPAIGGCDAVIAKREGRRVAGKRRHGIWFRGRIFLLESEKTLEEFVRSPDVFHRFAYPETDER